MTGFLLDTNVPSELIRPHPNPQVADGLAAQRLDSLFVSIVSFREW
jgi:predicted nucleic acid-binding protein